jgi:hypothetical protein
VDGTKTTVKAWQGTCVICGAPFEVTAPQNITGSHSFAATTCPLHKLTPKEVARLRFAKPAERQSIWQAIKADKIAVGRS